MKLQSFLTASDPLLCIVNLQHKHTLKDKFYSMT